MEIEIGQTRKQGDDQRQSNLIDYIGLFFRRKVNVVLPLHRKVDVKSVYRVCTTVPRSIQKSIRHTPVTYVSKQKYACSTLRYLTAQPVS